MFSLPVIKPTALLVHWSNQFQKTRPIVRLWFKLGLQRTERSANGSLTIQRDVRLCSFV
ncbi:hypothetical protein HanRHA438_Chr12g0534201 [Helianthus annuus]|nr:hypothetical protein HanRHA438_Chr12g0534201 [Helianthus annuus]